MWFIFSHQFTYKNLVSIYIKPVFWKQHFKIPVWNIHLLAEILTSYSFYVLIYLVSDLPSHHVCDIWLSVLCSLFPLVCLPLDWSKSLIYYFSLILLLHSFKIKQFYLLFFLLGKWFKDMFFTNYSIIQRLTLSCFTNSGT